MRRHLAQPEHLEKSRNAKTLQATMRRHLAQPEHLEKSRNAKTLQATLRRHLAQPDKPFIPPVVDKKTSSSSPKHSMRFLDGKRKNTTVFISKNKY
jgi:hypothetical protein